MEIRKAVPEDVDRILEITRIAWVDVSLSKLMEDRHGIIGGRRWWTYKMDQLRARCAQNLSSIFVAVEDGKVVGYATFGLDHASGVGHVTNNAVDPGYRGRGIGTALNRRVLDHLRGQGMRIAQVTTLENDHPARRVYEKNGFKELARSVHYTMELE